MDPSHLIIFLFYSGTFLTNLAKMSPPREADSLGVMTWVSDRTSENMDEVLGFPQHCNKPQNLGVTLHSFLTFKNPTLPIKVAV